MVIVEPPPHPCLVPSLIDSQKKSICLLSCYSRSNLIPKTIAQTSNTELEFWKCGGKASRIRAKAKIPCTTLHNQNPFSFNPSIHIDLSRL